MLVQFVLQKRLVGVVKLVSILKLSTWSVGIIPSIKIVGLKKLLLYAAQIGRKLKREL